ncbi:MAG: GYD domain-containing protein [Syntrophobacteraceae bacterium]
MAKYLYYGNYVGDGLKGLLKDGGSGRRAAVEKLVKSLGGTMECCYWDHGEYGWFCIADMPDKESATSMVLTINASLLGHVSAVGLLTAEEMDQVAKKSPTYRAPGQ